MTAVAAPLPNAPGFGRSFAALVVSAALHAALLAALIIGVSRQPERHRPNEISVEIHEIERPKPPPPPPPMPAQKIEHAVAKPKLVEKPPPKAPPPPNQPPPPEPPKAPPPIRIGVNLESTVPGGEFSAPVGNTMYGQAPERATPPAEAKPYWAAKYMPQTQVAELPVVLDEVRAPYPPEARKDGVEGDIVMLVTIDDQGRVAKVRKISGVGHGLDEAAIEAVKQFKWKPAKYNGVAVATEIRYTYSWELD